MLAYYGALVGNWRGTFDLRVTRPHALSRLAPLDRIGMRAFAWIRRTGAPEVQTSVRIEAGRVLHTMRVEHLGVALFESEELIFDGRLTGTLRMPPDPRRRPLHGTVVVAGDSARYELVWLGVPVQQHAVWDRAADTVTLTQHTPFSEGTQVLRRVPRARPSA